MRILCADAHDAQKRICAYYAHIMRILCLDANDARMLIICADFADAPINIMAVAATKTNPH